MSIAFAQMGYPNFDMPVPAFIGTGVQDRDTLLRMQAALVKTACEAGSVIQSHVYPAYDHVSVLNPSTRDSNPFVRAAFAGETILGNCERLPFQGL